MMSAGSTDATLLAVLDLNFNNKSSYNKRMVSIGKHDPYFSPIGLPYVIHGVRSSGKRQTPFSFGSIRRIVYKKETLWETRV